MMISAELAILTVCSLVIITLVVLAWISVSRNSGTDWTEFEMEAEEEDKPQVVIIAQTQEQAYWEAGRWNPADYRIRIITHAEQLRGLTITARDRVVYAGSFYAMKDLEKIAENVQICRLQG